MRVESGARCPPQDRATLTRVHRRQHPAPPACACAVQDALPGGHSRHVPHLVRERLAQLHRSQGLLRCVHSCLLCTLFCVPDRRRRRHTSSEHMCPPVPTASCPQPRRPPTRRPSATRARAPSSPPSRRRCRPPAWSTPREPHAPNARRRGALTGLRRVTPPSVRTRPFPTPRRSSGAVNQGVELVGSCVNAFLAQFVAADVDVQALVALGSCQYAGAPHKERAPHAPSRAQRCPVSLSEQASLWSLCALPRAPQTTRCPRACNSASRRCPTGSRPAQATMPPSPARPPRPPSPPAAARRLVTSGPTTASPARSSTPSTTG